MITTLEEYLLSLNDIKTNWVNEFIAYMNNNYPSLNVTIFRQLPMYKFEKSYLDGYILFSTNKNEFVIHTLFFDIIEEMKTILPKAKYGKGCVKVKFTDLDTLPILKEMIDKIAIKAHIKKENL